MNNTICLCGSTRFLDQFDQANRELTKCGLSVISISMCLPKKEQGSQEDANLKGLLDLVHLNKILRADAVFVVGDGYIGRSTAREILWAEMQGKAIVKLAARETWDELVYRLKRGKSEHTYFAHRARAVLGLPPALHSEIDGTIWRS